MKCSIIIPYNNDKDVLNMTLNSIDNQDFDKNEFEVQFINNSTDDLSDLIEQRKAASHVNYHYVECPTEGRSYARNAGIKSAKGEILIFLDCDQMVGQDFVGQHYQFFLEHPNENILQFGLRRQAFPVEPDCDLSDSNSIEDLDNQNEILKTGQRTKITNGSFYGNEFLNDYCTVDDIRTNVFEVYHNDISKNKGKFAFVQSNNFSIKKEFLLQYGGFDENFKGWGCEDWELAYRLQASGIQIYYNPNIGILHKYHEANYDENRYLQWKQNLDYFAQKYEGKLNNLYAFQKFFEPEKREELLKTTDIDSAYISCFQEFENGFIQ